jgi:hypothetical protein
LREILSGITAEQALERPLGTAHTIWELVVHIRMYVRAAIHAAEGIPMPKWYGSEADWPATEETTTAAWKQTTDSLFSDAAQLARVIEAHTDVRLQDEVPGRQYDFYFLFHGIVQHSLYHGGQIAMLKKAL